MTLFLGTILALGSALELLLGPITELVIVGCHIKSTFHHRSQSNQEMVCCCTEWEDNTSKWQLFWFAVSSWGTHLSSFFTFPICFKCRVTLCSFKRISFGDFHQLAVSFRCWPLRSSPSGLLSPLRNFWNHHYCTLAFPGPDVLLMLRVVSTALWPILNLNKKITRIYFLSNIISIV